MDNKPIEVTLSEEFEAMVDAFYCSTILTRIAVLLDEQTMFNDAANISLKYHCKIKDFLDTRPEHMDVYTDVFEETNRLANNNIPLDDEASKKYIDWIMEFKKTLHFIDKNGNPVDSDGNPICKVDLGEVDSEKFNEFFNNKDKEEDT